MTLITARELGEFWTNCMGSLFSQRQHEFNEFFFSFCCHLSCSVNLYELKMQKNCRRCLMNQSSHQLLNVEHALKCQETRFYIENDSKVMMYNSRECMHEWILTKKETVNVRFDYYKRFYLVFDIRHFYNLI